MVSDAPCLSRIQDSRRALCRRVVVLTAVLFANSMALQGQHGVLSRISLDSDILTITRDGDNFSAPYRVQPNETYQSISQKFYGSPDYGDLLRQAIAGHPAEQAGYVGLGQPGSQERYVTILVPVIQLRLPQAQGASLVDTIQQFLDGHEREGLLAVSWNGDPEAELLCPPGGCSRAEAADPDLTRLFLTGMELKSIVLSEPGREAGAVLLLVVESQPLLEVLTGTVTLQQVTVESR